MSGHNILQQLSREPELEIMDPGASGTIAIDRTLGVCPIVTAGAEGRVIAEPVRAGIILTLALKTDGGNATVTTAGSETINAGGTEGTQVVLDTAGDSITLISIPKGSDIVWAVLANNGGTVS
ncbi:hypothetical protein [Acinetobacter sp.]|uniref:hypothetical protein n=1 Tax=Acinetobacter sp. TaxID=472 RepID=UPI000C0B442D|nr:hypothetical protein [Acinetobacter sp.]MAK30932.1 hypothetical protein [Acinetobacter sp.]|tara:strand:- start:5353 stop:5721 length:369 start_codon:yes stop_codon:yes gene_type:complete